jgi:hypothetical protein
VVGGLLSVALGVVNSGLAVVAAGWAMSKVAAQQIETGVAAAPDLALSSEPGPLASSALEPEPLDRIAAEALEPVAASVPVVRAAPLAAAAPIVASPAIAAPVPAPAPAVEAAPAPPAGPAPAARPAPVAAPPRPAVAADRPQCPKCNLYETERGTVIGWYCKVCGWREGKSR